MNLQETIEKWKKRIEEIENTLRGPDCLSSDHRNNLLKEQEIIINHISDLRSVEKPIPGFAIIPNEDGSIKS